MFKSLYLHLFNRVTDALEAIRSGDSRRAAEILVAAQQECEEMYLESGED